MSERRQVTVTLTHAEHEVEALMVLADGTEQYARGMTLAAALKVLATNFEARAAIAASAAAFEAPTSEEGTDD